MTTIKYRSDIQWKCLFVKKKFTLMPVDLVGGRKKGHFCIIQYYVLELNIDWYCIIDDDLFIWKM